MSEIIEVSYDYAEMLLDRCDIPADQKYCLQIEINDCKDTFELEEVINRMLLLQPQR